MAKRERKIQSFKKELLVKSRESMLSAVQIFNNPNIHFKSENFIILANISWMYLLHAFYREKKLNIDILNKLDKGKNLIKQKKEPTNFGS